MTISPARAAAFDILIRIEIERAYSSVVLPIYEQHLSLPDRGLTHELTLGVLRRQIYLDRIIDQFSNHKKLDISVRIALRLGLYQLLFLDKIPAHAAINESVNLVQKAKKTSAKGFVNAILRRALREPIQQNFADEIDRLSVEASHPRWLVERWIFQFGADLTVKILAANNDVPRTAFRFVDPTHSSLLSGAALSEFIDGCFTTESIDSDLLDLAAKNEIYFQDEASQLIAASVNLDKRSSFLDVCAAPGGKSTLIATRAATRRHLFVAGDIRWPRVELLRKNCQNQNAGFINVVQYDATRELPFSDESFDVVLLDAPCTGTGTIRHNPEIRYFLKADDFAELSAKQLVMLKNASKLVKSGGSIVYSTCSIEQEENEEVCGRFLNEHADFSLIIPGVDERFATADGFARTYPHRDRMDGFFLAKFRRH